MPSTIAQKTEAHITRHGLPEMILSDNGPQFIGTEYKQLCQKYQIQHITSSPYWSQGNGKSEASVKIVKRILKKSGKHNLNEALLLYRNTPQVGHTLTPAQSSMGRRLRCMLPTSRHLLLPRDGTSTSVTNTIAETFTPPQIWSLAVWSCHCYTLPKIIHCGAPSGLTRRNREIKYKKEKPSTLATSCPAPTRRPCSQVMDEDTTHVYVTHYCGLRSTISPSRDTKETQPIVSHESRRRTLTTSVTSQLPLPSARSPTSLIGRKKDTPRKIEPSPPHTQENTSGKAPTITRAGRVSKPVIRLDL